MINWSIIHLVVLDVMIKNNVLMLYVHDKNMFNNSHNKIGQKHNIILFSSCAVRNVTTCRWSTVARQ